MINLNPYHDGKIDIDSDLVAYIDESGDEGFEFTKGSMKWFNVSGYSTTFNEASNAMVTIRDFRDKYCPQKTNLHRLTFKELTHNNRKNVLTMLYKHNYLTVHSVFYKPSIDSQDIMCTFPSMYFIGVLNVLERLTWLTKQFNKNRIHVLISNRSNISSDGLKTYLFTKSIRASANLAYQEKIGFVGLSTPTNHSKLLLADYSASSMHQCLEKVGEANIAEPVYAKLFLKKKIFVSNYSGHTGVWNNGIKCIPDDKGLLENGDILEEGSHNF